MKKTWKSLLPLVIGLTWLPSQALAHGTAAEHQEEVLSGSVPLVIGALFVILLIQSIVFKNKMRKNRFNFLKWGWIISLIAFLVTGAIYLWGGQNSATGSTTLKHVHGLGFTSDGEKVMIPAHDGLRVFSKGTWSIPEGSKHDYMGFSMTDDGFYSSGHPAPGSDLPNPLGFVKSTDEGRSIQSLALLGETDFHGMAVGYRSHAIYAITPQPNSQMESPGMYVSVDDAKTWRRSELNGIHEPLSALAVHPDKQEVVAAGTGLGVYLSEDYGNTFKKIMDNVRVTALTFAFDGELFVGAVKENPTLLKLNVETRKSEEVAVPVINDDVIQYIAQNPTQPKTMAIATAKKDVYLTPDAGVLWHRIADQGKGAAMPKNDPQHHD